MLRATTGTTLAIVGVLLLLGVAATVPAGADQEDHEARVLKIRVERDAEGGEGEARAVFIGEDGEVEELAGGDLEWVARMAGHGEHLFARPGGAFLGVQLTDLTPELRQHFGVTADGGVMVAKVVAGSAAASAGIRVGDIITAVDGEEVAGSGALARAIGGHQPGETVLVELWREGRVESLSATLGEHEGTAWAGGPHQRRIVVRCEDGEDCGAHLRHHRLGHLPGLDCGDAEECEVHVECHDGGCTCTVNGEETDCAVLHHGDE